MFALADSWLSSSSYSSFLFQLFYTFPHEGENGDGGGEGRSGDLNVAGG